MLHTATCDTSCCCCCHYVLLVVLLSATATVDAALATFCCLLTRPTALGAGGPARSSGGLTSLGLSSSSGGLGGGVGGGSAGGAAGGAGGRGAGPDHREVRYAEGVLAMINILRVLTLGGPRITDAAAIQQVCRGVLCLC